MTLALYESRRRRKQKDWGVADLGNGHSRTEEMRPMPIGPDGRLWSNHLESFLVPDEAYLRLYDRYGQLRLTEAEEERRRAERLAEKLRSLGIDPDQL
jgi:hypothetical protein